MKHPVIPHRVTPTKRRPILIAGTAVCAMLAAMFFLGPRAHAQATDANVKDLALVPAAGPLAGKAVYRHSFALLIGINHYPNLPPEHSLSYAVKDATDLRDVLVQSYGFPAGNITLLTDAQATKRNIQDALDDLTDTVHVGPNDRILIFFSGHGQTIATTEGGDLGFLIPEDAKVDLSRPDNVGPYNHSCLSMSGIREILRSCPAKHVLLIADACYSGLLNQPKAPEALRPEVVAEMMSLRARQVLTAGRKGETSTELSEYGHGAFTYKLLEQLRGRAMTPGNIFTTSDLYSSLRTSVSNMTGGRQLPQLGSFDTEGDFLFITAPSSTPTVGATKINPKDGAEMVYVPAGPFLMGDDDREDNPRHTVTLSGYYIYKNVVTVAMYRKFCQETGRQMPSPPRWGWQYDQPIVNVIWADAKAYCDWAGVHLPSEAQWEKAARGTDGRTFPWGTVFDASRLQCSKNAFYDAGSTAPVGHFPSGASPYGLLDMDGNVDQWCADWYDVDYWKSDHGPDPTGPSSGQKRSLRGAGFDGFPSEHLPWFHSAWRSQDSPNNVQDVYGFRGAF